MTSPYRPDTFADCLLNLCRWLDTVDDYLHKTAPGAFPDAISNHDAQDDLRRLAANLRGTELDATIMELMDTRNLDR